MTRKIINRINQELEAGRGLVLATILKRIGSAPRSSGSRMLVFGDQSIFGTIGGGRLEAKVREKAGEVMRTKTPEINDYHFSGSDAAAMEMICGGSVSILTEWLDPGNPILAQTFHDLASLEVYPQNTWWIQAVLPGLQVLHGCLLPNWETARGVKIVTGMVREVEQTAWLEAPQASYFIENLNQAGSVLIFGAGHVSQPVAHLCHLVDFRTIICDDRPEFASRERFPDADEILVTGEFETMIQGRVIDENTSVVIITRGHLNDQAVLESILNTRAGYIGMIGSRRKWRLLRDDLLSKGYPVEQIERVHSPIGLDIGAETPAEIAISIVAELVKARAGRNQSPKSASYVVQ